MTFADIISKEDQYEVAKARATISLAVLQAAALFRMMDAFLDARFSQWPS